MNSPTKVPDFVTHYSRGEPFRSMTSVPSDKWNEVVADMNETNAWGLSRFADQEYLGRRFEVEKRLRQEFITKGGKPQLENPIYFFLGRNDRFEQHKDNRGYLVYLKDIPSELITFTYGDSLLAYNQSYRTQLDERYQNPLCAKIFRVEELESLFSSKDFPQEGFLSIEAQLWVMPAKDIVKSMTSICS